MEIKVAAEKFNRNDENWKIMGGNVGGNLGELILWSFKEGFNPNSNYRAFYIKKKIMFQVLSFFFSFIIYFLLTLEECLRKKLESE